MIVERDAFCLHLKQARERSGLTLEAISDVTKIQASLLAGLERGDLSRWPTAIFRRAFVREYAAAIGLPPEQVVGEFCRLFPEHGAPTVSPSLGGPALQDGLGGMRMTLAQDWRYRIAPSRARALAAILDLLIVYLVGRVVSQLVPGNFWVVMGASALIYYPLSTACSGATLGSLWLTSRPDLRWRRVFRRAEKPRTVDRPHLVFRRSERSHQSVPNGTDAESAAARDLRAASN